MANVKNYRKQGGEEWVVGGKVTVESGGEQDFESGSELKIAGTQVTATAAQLNSLGTYMKIAKVAMASGDQNAISFAWQNPEDTAVIVHRVIADVTTAAGAAATMDIGITTGDDQTADNLLNGFDINDTGVYDNIDDQGTNGESKGRMDKKGETNDYITGKILDANASNLVGNVYIYYSAV